jgi:anaerobic ribonucleoside-triphosphate reductase activating protein
MKIRIAGIIKNSIVDGPGIRYAVFGQGCPFMCEDCHNPHTHDVSGGKLVDVEQIAEEIKRDPLLDGVTFSGGEPFMQIREFAELAGSLDGHRGFKAPRIVCYTGYSLEELLLIPQARILLDKIDVLIDGRFEKKHKSFELRFRGSSNQRVLDLKESLKCEKAVDYSKF